MAVDGGIPAHLVDFVEALRRKGIPVGPSEAVDAAAAMLHVDLLDRAALNPLPRSVVYPWFLAAEATSLGHGVARVAPVEGLDT